MPATVFHPRPNVESALVVLRRRGPSPDPGTCALVHAAFAHRRKALPGRWRSPPARRRDCATRRGRRSAARPAGRRARRAAGAGGVGGAGRRDRDELRALAARRRAMPLASARTRRSTSCCTSGPGRAPTGSTRSARCSPRSTSPTTCAGARRTRARPETASSARASPAPTSPLAALAAFRAARRCRAPAAQPDDREADPGRRRARRRQRGRRGRAARGERAGRPAARPGELRPSLRAGLRRAEPGRAAARARRRGRASGSSR